jgi:hypothetical protein
VPITLTLSDERGRSANTETGKLGFRIEDRITPEQKLAARRAGRAQ